MCAWWKPAGNCSAKSADLSEFARCNETPYLRYISLWACVKVRKYWKDVASSDKISDVCFPAPVDIFFPSCIEFYYIILFYTDFISFLIVFIDSHWSVTAEPNALPSIPLLSKVKLRDTCGHIDRLAFKLQIHLRQRGRGGWDGQKSERWSGSRAFGEKCSHSIAVRGHPGKSWLVEEKRCTNNQNFHKKDRQTEYFDIQ